MDRQVRLRPNDFLSPSARRAARIFDTAKSRADEEAKTPNSMLENSPLQYTSHAPGALHHHSWSVSHLPALSFPSKPMRFPKAAVTWLALSAVVTVSAFILSSSWRNRSLSSASSPKQEATDDAREPSLLNFAARSFE